MGDGEAKASTQDQDGEARGELLGFIGINRDLSGLIERKWLAMTVGRARLKPLHRTKRAERRGEGRWAGAGEARIFLLLVVFF